MGCKNYNNGFAVTCHPDVLHKPLGWKTPRMIFVNSMSDIFHEKIYLEFIHKIFDTIKMTPHHTYQILTKRSERMAELSKHLEWHDNIWMGVTVASQGLEHRIDNLRSIPAKIKFLSLELLLTELPNLDLIDIDWVIVGGESGPRCRSMQKEWVESIHRQCLQSGVPFFFKQWGGIRKKNAGRKLNGKVYSEMPIIDDQKSIAHQRLAAKAGSA
jgi:protein gp37